MSPLGQPEPLSGSDIPIHTPQWDAFPLDILMASRMSFAHGTDGRSTLPQATDTTNEAGIAYAPDVTDVFSVSGKLNRAAIDRWHIEGLHSLLHHVLANSPFYANHLAGVDPDAIRTRDDLTRLPRIMADDIRHSGLEMVCVSQDEIARIVTLDTSGTSGIPKRLYFSQDDLDRTKEFFTMGMQAVACEGDTVLALLPDERPSSVGRLLAQSVLNMGARPLSGSITRGGEALAVMALKEQVRVIIGSPMHLRSFALGWQAMGFPKGVIHTVLLCWDAIPQAVIETLHNVLGCRVLTHWGMTETGLGGALACADEPGMHLREDELLAEITDPATGIPLPDGEWGELTITTLCRRAMPLIRYRTGDYGRILPDACTCGSPLRRMDRSPGRLQDDIPLPDDQILRLIDLDNALLPLHNVMDFTAHWHDGHPAHTDQTTGHNATERNNTGARGQEKSTPLLNIALQVAPIQPPSLAGQSIPQSLLAQSAIQRLNNTPVLAGCLEHRHIRLQVSVIGEGCTSMDYAKRRIKQFPPADTMPTERNSI